MDERDGKDNRRARRRRRRILGAILIGAGAISCLFAVLQYRTNYYLEQRADRYVQEVLPELSTFLERSGEQEGDRSVEDESGLPDELVVLLDGKGYLGILQFPTLELTLPVFALYNNANLNLAPCRYSGTAAGRDLVIAGHNYKKQFSPLRRLAEGDEIILTQAGGVQYSYVVDSQEIVDGMAVDEMLEGDWDMTLFTCTMDHVRRIAVRCSLADAGEVYAGAY